MLEHVVQMGFGVFILGDVKNPTGCGPGQPTRADLALTSVLT